MDIKQVSGEGNVLSVTAGVLIVKENDSSRKMFIIRKGKVRVFKIYMGQRVTLAILGEGEIFGEMSFIDAAPRSASVEALTGVEVLEISGESASKQIQNLPSWVLPIFKSVFHRFRELDQKIIVMQSMNEFQKKAFKLDVVGKTIYLELLRFIKALSLVVAGYQQNGGIAREIQVFKDLESMLGKCYIGLRTFWNLLKESDFFDSQCLPQGELRLRTEPINALTDYLLAETKSERFLVLSHTTLAVLRRIVGFVNANEETDQNDVEGEFVFVKFEDLQIQTIPLFESSLPELSQLGILHHFEGSKEYAFKVQPGRLYRLFMYQSFLKSFDHTIVNLD